MKEIEFLLISDPKIWAINVKECYEPMVDLKDLHFNISLARASFYAGYTKVRLSVAEKLLQAAKQLPKGMTFLFSEGHRPISLQRKMYTEYCEQLAHSNPTWDESKVKREATKFIASPEDVPPHSTGGAIDITLLDANGKELDMGSILDDMPDKNQNRNYTFADNIPDYAKANRQVLIDALSNVGFINYPAEWWHWSYGDKYWAYHTHHSQSIYDSTD